MMGVFYFKFTLVVDGNPDNVGRFDVNMLKFPSKHLMAALSSWILPAWV